MKLVAIFLLAGSVAFAAVKPTPMEQVRILAAGHKVSITPRNGIYWVEVEGSDIFGTGKTINEAAEDFIHDADPEAHETNRPDMNKKWFPYGQPTKSIIPDCNKVNCS